MAIGSVAGCSTTNTAKPDPSQIAVEQFRKQIISVAQQTVQNINNANKISFSKDERSDWVGYLDEEDTLNMVLDLSYVGDNYNGNFGNLIKLVAERTGYRVLDFLQDKKINNKIVPFQANQTTGLSALYTGYSRVSHEKIDLVIRPKQKIILLRRECVDNYDCDRLYNITDS